MRSKTIRTLTETTRNNDAVIIRNGKKLISFSCNDYLGLTQHPKVKQAAIDAINKYGAGSGSSRYITGNYPLYSALEKKLAEMKETENCLVFGSGYMANIGIIPTIVGKGDIIIADKLVHSCILDGMKLSGAKMLRFKHNDVESCLNLLKNNRHNFKKCLIITETVFSMDGDIAPLEELYQLAEEYNALIMTDDAHRIGVINAYTGHPEFISGSLAPRTDKNKYIQMGTLSKATGSYGGYICASDSIINELRNNSKTAVYSTALPPSAVAAAIASLEIITSDRELTAKPIANARLFTSILGIKPAQSPIVPIILGDSDETTKASLLLEENGYYVHSVKPPTVAENTSRLRFTFASWHKEEDIRKVAKILLSFH